MIYPIIFIQIVVVFAVQSLRTVNAQQVATIEGIVSVMGEPTINVRSGPNVLFDSLGTLRNGETVAIISESSGGSWLQITFPAGSQSIGWVFKRYIAVNAAVTIPKFEADEEADKPGIIETEPASVLIPTVHTFTNNYRVVENSTGFGLWIVILLALSGIFAVSGWIYRR